MFHRTRLVIALALLAAAAPISADDGKVPFWAALKISKDVNMRVGPGKDYRILWVFHRAQLPLKVLRTMQGWWQVEDPEGARGWMLAQFMTKRRSAMVSGTAAVAMHEMPDATSRLLWRLSPGIVGHLGECSSGWCQIELDGGRAGWVEQGALWGAADL